MDFELSEDQQALAGAAGALLDDRCGPAAVRRVVDGGAGFDPDLWGAMADQGWCALEVPEADGGLGLGLVEVAVLAEQVGRHLGPVPFGPTTVAVHALGSCEDGGADGKRSRAWHERLAAGEGVGCVAWSAAAGSVVAAAGDGESWRLSGRPAPVVFGPVADVAVVVASTGAGEGVFGIELDDGCRPVPEPAMDRTRCLGWLRLDDTPAWRVGDEEDACHLLDRSVAVVCAEMLGAADRALRMTVDYAKDRVQFGRPIGSFQAIKHRCSDMLVDVEGMRSTAYYAAWSVQHGGDEASVAASSAKAWAGDAAKRVMASALQVHGGIGFTWEHDLHLYMKRSQLDQVSFGDAAYHRDRLARLLRARIEAGEPVL